MPCYFFSLLFLASCELQLFIMCCCVLFQHLHQQFRPESLRLWIMWCNRSALGHPNCQSGCPHLPWPCRGCQRCKVLSWWEKIRDWIRWWYMQIIWSKNWASAPILHSRTKWRRWCPTRHLHCILCLGQTTICCVLQWRLLCLGHISRPGMLFFPLHRPRSLSSFYIYTLSFCANT